MPINYSFSLNGNTVHPIYGDDLVLDYEKESNQEYFRKILNGSFSFIGEDFTYINSQPIDTEFWLKVNINDDPIVYAQGKFYKTDCKINLDDSIVDVDIQAKDSYDNVLSGINNLYDLAKLEVARTRLYLDKRPMIQTYIPDDNSIGCFFNGNSWEQEVVEPTSDPTQYNFTLASTFYRISITGDGTPSDVIDDYVSKDESFLLSSGSKYSITERTGAEYSFTGGTTDKTSSDIGSIWLDSNNRKWQLKLIIGDILYFTQYLHSFPPPNGPDTLTHSENGTNTSDVDYFAAAAVPGGTSRIYYTLEQVGVDIVYYSKNVYDSVPSGDILFWAYLAGGIGSGIVNGFKQTIDIYGRILLDTDYYDGNPTTDIPQNDLVQDNRNYNKTYGYAIDSFTIYSSRITSPTIYGIADDGKYFVEPPPSTGVNWYPMSRRNWALSSIWFSFTLSYDSLDIGGRKNFESKENMLLSDVIKTLLSEIDSTVTHEATTDYSELLYSSSNPLSGTNTTIMISQKSNILAGELDEPARKEEIRLSSVLEMLKNTYEAYWFIDDQDRFRIEHISWFKNGGSYSQSPVIGADLTDLKDSRNNKPFALYTSKFEYDKQTLPERYEFSWMDDVTNTFKGYPIIINSKYVERGNIEEIKISEFTTDIDYMLLNSDEIGKDGYALMEAVFDDTNLFDINDPNNTIDTIVNYSQGIEQPNVGTNTTDFIEVVHESEYSFSSTYMWAWYDSSKTYISGSYYPLINTSVLKSPPGAAYLKMSVLSANWNNLEIVKGKSLDGHYSLPYVVKNYNSDNLHLQNGYLTWLYIHPIYWTSDLPSSNFNMNNGELILYRGLKRNKIQTVNYPSLTDPDPTKLIKTYLGNGDIEKISVNLSSRNNEIELRYDTE